MCKKLLLISLAAIVLIGGCENKNNSKMENKQLIIAASVKIKPEKVSEFIEKTKSLIESSRAEEGCISYTLYQCPTDSTVFMFFEEWKDQAAIDFHFNTPHFKGFAPISQDCAAEPSKLKIYDAILRDN